MIRRVGPAGGKAPLVNPVVRVEVLEDIMIVKKRDQRPFPKYLCTHRAKCSTHTRPPQTGC